MNFCKGADDAKEEAIRFGPGTKGAGLSNGSSREYPMVIYSTFTFFYIETSFFFFRGPFLRGPPFKLTSRTSPPVESPETETMSEMSSS